MHHLTFASPFRIQPSQVLLAITGVAYALVALAFAALYALDPSGNGVDGARDGRFDDLFFFSMRTLSTTDSSMVAESLWANLVCSLEGFVGLIFHAMVTGSLFAKLSKPVARIAFADRCLIQEVAPSRNLLATFSQPSRHRLGTVAEPSRNLPGTSPEPPRNRPSSLTRLATPRRRG